MLANTYKEYNDNKIIIEKYPESPSTEYKDVTAKNFIEPAGMHHFSINKKRDGYAPFFTLDSSPIGASIISTYGYDTNNFSGNIITNSDSSKFKYYKKDILANYFTESDLKSLATKFNVTFKENQQQAGILEITPYKTNAAHYAITPVTTPSDTDLIIEANNYLLVKIVAKISSLQTLKYNATINNVNYPNNNNTIVGFCKQKRNDSTETFNIQFQDTITGTDDWAEYNFMIFTQNSELNLSNLCFYVDYLPTETTEKCYIVYMDCLIIPDKYKQLWSYSPFENVTAIKYGCLFDRNFIEANQLSTHEVDIEHMVHMTAQVTTRKTRKSRRK